MLEYDKIYISERIDANKTNASKECDICHYWYIFRQGFEIQAISLQWLSWFNEKSYEF